MTLSTERRFVLKAGDRLERDKSPAVAGRAFTITAKFDTRGAKDGVIIAQGGSAHGYAMFLVDGRLSFLVRSGSGVATATASRAISGVHVAVARLDRNGKLSLALDGQPAASADTRGPMTTMPVDGLDVGCDTAGAVGPYKAPNRFIGEIEEVVVELDAP